MNYLQNIISNKNQCKGTALSDKKKKPIWASGGQKTIAELT